MNKLKLKFCTLFLVFTLSGIFTIAVAQQQGALRILVLSGRNGNSLIGANVQLTPVSSRGEKVTKFKYGAVTNGNGLVEFNEISFGMYKLKIGYIGYKNFSRVLTISEPGIKVLEVTLEPKTEKLESLVVEAPKGEKVVGNVGVYTITPKR